MVVAPAGPALQAPSWLPWVVVNYMNRTQKSYDDVSRAEVFATYDPDFFEWGPGRAANGRNFMRMRGIPFSAHSHYEYNSLNYNASDPLFAAFFSTNGVCRNESGVAQRLVFEGHDYEFGFKLC